LAFLFTSLVCGVLRGRYPRKQRKHWRFFSVLRFGA